MSLFGEHHGIPQLALAWIERWALLLGSYTYSIQYKPCKELQHANGLSRLLLPDTLESVSILPEIIHLVNILNSSPITVSDIKSCTVTDLIISKVATLVSQGWTNKGLEKILPHI